MPADNPPSSPADCRRSLAVVLRSAGLPWGDVASALGYFDRKAARRAVRTELDRRISTAERELVEARDLVVRIFGAEQAEADQAGSTR